MRINKHMMKWKYKNKTVMGWRKLWIMRLCNTIPVHCIKHLQPLPLSLTLVAWSSLPWSACFTWSVLSRGVEWSKGTGGDLIGVFVISLDCFLFSLSSFFNSKFSFSSCGFSSSSLITSCFRNVYLLWLLDIG